MVDTADYDVRQVTWAQVTALEDTRLQVDALHALTRDYMTEAGLWVDVGMHRALIETAHRLASIAEHAIDRVIVDVDHADVVDAFVFAGRLQLDHVQSVRRFAGGQAPTILPRRGGRS